MQDYICVIYNNNIMWYNNYTDNIKLSNKKHDIDYGVIKSPTGHYIAKLFKINRNWMLVEEASTKDNTIKNVMAVAINDTGENEKEISDLLKKLILNRSVFYERYQEEDLDSIYKEANKRYTELTKDIISGILSLHNNKVKSPSNKILMGVDNTNDTPKPFTGYYYPVSLPHTKYIELSEGLFL